MNDTLMTDVEFRKMMDEEKKARLDNEALKGASICVKIVNKCNKNISLITYSQEGIIILY